MAKLMNWKKEYDTEDDRLFFKANLSSYASKEDVVNATMIEVNKLVNK